MVGAVAHHSAADAQPKAAGFASDRQAQKTARLIAAASAIAPQIAARAEQAERARRVPDETVREIAAAGIYEMLTPERWGGHELGLSAFIKVIRALSPLCASTGWTTAFYIAHNWMWCLLPETAQAEIFADGPSRLGPVMVAPSVRARPVAGGFLLNGRARWGTGSAHASWCMVSGIVEGDAPAAGGTQAGPPQVRMFAMPWDQVRWEDTWRTSGMAATASHDVIFENVLVPEHRVVETASAREGRGLCASLYPGAVYRTPFTPLLCVAALTPLVAATLGAAHHAVERAKSSASSFSGKTSADQPAQQIRLAKADLGARGAWTLLEALVADIEDSANATPVDILVRADFRARASHIASICRDVVTHLAHGGGASAHMLDSPIQRAFRDVSMGACHVVFDHDPTMEIHGKILVGDPPSVILA